ncbi:CRISPR system Cascade subunit CasA [Methylomarinovum caldicuralii]|uniref:CRISPR system Cascade subunit CasA n=1 Tax=Methylomarinovum caldicuralii TaxID=438856 RepID=A0AAU9BW31_9GAMM|nr:type I-E CRISPR-associated protein Cse1/CasA [Methylomarinovum caldicuralii]BCX83021.1 CRISPR system Cascade subunit CasA [Methylomarinovum caldicuralii]
MNLLDTPWIPVRRSDGSRTLIRPAEIADSDNPPVALDSPRADFNGALAQFLIGLLQTCYAPIDDGEWEDRLEQPPLVAALDQAFARYHDAFEVDGEGPRFMQDYEALEKSLTGQKLKNATKPIEWLFIDAPTENTLENNADHFVKRGHVEALCPACAVTALFTLQINAPAGGKGQMSSIRSTNKEKNAGKYSPGQGALTTLVALDPEGSCLPDTLWHHLWLNVLPQTVPLTGNPKLSGPEHIFPWLAPTRTSEKGQSVTPEDAHPYQMYWAMPRRIRLDFGDTKEGDCDLCGRRDRLLLRYVTLNYGINYAGAWRHPMTPYVERSEGKPLPLHPQPGGITYRHWIGLIYEEPEGQKRLTPAIVVREFQRKKLPEEQFRLWAFGYDMDNMKPRCWYEAILPLYRVPEEIRPDFTKRVAQLIEAAEYVAGLLKRQVKEAWFKRPGDVKEDVGFLADGFYQHTEADFYACLPRLIDALAQGKDPEVLQGWHATLTRAALELFDEWTGSDEIAFADPARVARACDNLRKQLYGARLARILTLPKKPKEKAA